MAFLCPARRKKSKIKIKGTRPLEAPIPGRITGSASIDTLVRVGLEKQYGTRTPMVVLHDFFPCVDDELAVKRNQVVHLLYQENDWMYVIADGGKEGFIPYTYCLPVQRSVDDFVVQKSKKKRNSSEDRQNLIAPHEKYKDTRKEHKPLARSTSKSLPDISDIGTNSSESTGFTSRNSRYPYHSDSGRPMSYNFGYTNRAYNKSTTSSHHGSKHENGLLPNGEDSLLDTSVADLRIASAQVREKQKQFLQTQKLSKSRENNSTAGMAHSKSAPSSPRSTHSHHSNSSISHSHHSGRSGSNTQRNHRHIQSVSQKYPNNSHNYHHVHSSGHQRTHSSHEHSNRSRSGSIGATDDPLNKSWGGPSSSGQHLFNNTGRSLNSSLPAYPGMYSSSRSYTNHPYGLSSSANHHSRNQHSHSTSAVQRPNTQSSKTTEARKFNKTLQGQYIVLFQFTAQQENDISVERGEFVTVLNKEDTDWYWIRRSDNQEGFVPSNYVRQADSIPIHSETSPRHSNGPPSPHSSVGAPNTSHQIQNHHHMQPQRNTAQSNPNNHRTNQNATRGSTRLVCLYDYRAQAPDDLTVSRGEWLYSDFNKQDDPDWLWVFSPSQSKAGYIPRTYAKPPNFASMQNNRDYGV